MKDNRKQQILNLLTARGYTNVTELASRFNVTTETIRRDLNELEQENRELRAHHRAVMRELRTLSETEARLIQEREIDRQALATVVGKIGTITWREINVG